MMYMRALGVSQNAANACRSRETLSAPDLQPLSNSGLKKSAFPPFFRLHGHALTR
jgi:hypothetical protein